MTIRAASVHQQLLKLTMSGCALLLLMAPASFAESIAPVDPALKQAVDQLIEQYIRSHPEVVEQSLQALEVKRQEEEKHRVTAALATRQNDLLHDPASPVSGNLKGDVTVVEFFDYRCGYCKRVAGVVTQLQKDDARVRVIYRGTFPFSAKHRSWRRKLLWRPTLKGKHQVFHEALLASKGDLTQRHHLGGCR